MFLLHLVVYAVRALDAGFDLIFEAGGVELLAYRAHKLLDDAVAVVCALVDQRHYLLILARMLIAEGEVFEFLLYFEQAETVCQRRVYVQRLTGYLVLLLGAHRAEGAHVVEAVGHLDEHHADVGRHGQEQLAEILGLQRGLVAEYPSRNFRQPLHYVGYLVSESGCDVVPRIVGVLDHVVEQRGADGGGTQPEFRDDYPRHGYRVHDVRLSAQAAHATVSLTRKLVCAVDDFHLLAVVGGQVCTEKTLVRLVGHTVFLTGGVLRIVLDAHDRRVLRRVLRHAIHKVTIFSPYPQPPSARHTPPGVLQRGYDFIPPLAVFKLYAFVRRQQLCIVLYEQSCV